MSDGLSFPKRSEFGDGSTNGCHIGRVASKGLAQLFLKLSAFSGLTGMANELADELARAGVASLSPHRSGMLRMAKTCQILPSGGLRRDAAVSCRFMTKGGKIRTLGACSLGEVLEAAKELAEGPFKGRAMWFRGQANVGWSLVPGLWRPQVRVRPEEHAESSMVETFRLAAPSRHRSCPPWDDYPAWLFLMQHHGLPTRLLDWSENLLVATFFACELVGNAATEDAAVWVLAPGLMNHRQLSSRHVDYIALPYSDEARGLFKRPFYPRFALEGCCPKVLAVSPQEVNLRITLQQSRFTIHKDGTSLDEFAVAHECLVRITIPAAAKLDMLQDLGRVGFSRSALFHDLSSLAHNYLSEMELKRSLTHCGCGKPADIYRSDFTSHAGGAWLCSACAAESGR